MFYCDSCAKKRGWPIELFSRSIGPCEVCKNNRDCNDVPSRVLPKTKAKTDKKEKP